MRKKFMQSMLLVPALAIASFAVGCVHTTTPEEKDSPTSADPGYEPGMELLAKVDLSGGGQVRFLGAGSAIFAIVEGSSDADPLANSKHTDPLAFYEALAHAPAPAALVRAAELAAALQRPEGTVAPEPLIVEPILGTGGAADLLSADAFCTLLDFDYGYCLKSRTGNGEFREPGGSMVAHVEGVRGRVRLTTEYWDYWALTWRVVRDRTLEEGDRVTLSVHSFFTTMLRSRIREANGDLYHVKVYGFR